MRVSKTIKRLINCSSIFLTVPPTAWTKIEAALPAIINGERAKIRPVDVTGARSRARNRDHSTEIEHVLNVLSVPYKRGNDAPRGGEAGSYLEIRSTKAVRDTFIDIT